MLELKTVNFSDKEAFKQRVVISYYDNQSIALTY